MVGESPPCRARRLAIARRSGFRTTRKTSARYAASPTTRGTAQRQLKAPFTRSEIAPSIIHPETSSIAAAPMVRAAVRVWDSPSSMKIRPRTGIAVMGGYRNGSMRRRRDRVRSLTPPSPPTNIHKVAVARAKRAS